jgi:hypothetical protein
MSDEIPGLIELDALPEPQAETLFDFAGVRYALYGAANQSWSLSTELDFVGDLTTQGDGSYLFQHRDLAVRALEGDDWRALLVEALTPRA